MNRRRHLTIADRRGNVIFARVVCCGASVAAAQPRAIHVQPRWLAPTSRRRRSGRNPRRGAPDRHAALGRQTADEGFGAETLEFERGARTHVFMSKAERSLQHDRRSGEITISCEEESQVVRGLRRDFRVLGVERRKIGAGRCPKIIRPQTGEVERRLCSDTPLSESDRRPIGNDGRVADPHRAEPHTAVEGLNCVRFVRLVSPRRPPGQTLGHRDDSFPTRWRRFGRVVVFAYSGHFTC